jgi:hypothetical protein
MSVPPMAGYMFGHAKSKCWSGGSDYKSDFVYYSPITVENRGVGYQRDDVTRCGGRAFLFRDESQRVEATSLLTRFYLLNNNDTSSPLHQMNP